MFNIRNLWIQHKSAAGEKPRQITANDETHGKCQTKSYSTNRQKVPRERDVWGLSEAYWSLSYSHGLTLVALCELEQAATVVHHSTLENLAVETDQPGYIQHSSMFSGSQYFEHKPEWSHSTEMHKGYHILCVLQPHHNRFTALFPGPPRWAGARRELLDFMVQGKINRGRHTDHPAGRHSIQTNLHHLHHSPFLQARCPSCRPTNSVKTLNATKNHAKSQQLVSVVTKSCLAHFPRYYHFSYKRCK